MELTLPGAFRAWPGELVELEQKVCRGVWRVAESVSGLDGRGTYTALTLAAL